LRLWIPKGVFLPVWTVSTVLLARVLDGLLSAQKGLLLDVGCGSGALAIYAAIRGWRSVCLEPNSIAREAARTNSMWNSVDDKVIVVDEPSRAVSLGGYDVIVTNPPYLPCEPKDPLDTLWCAGRDLRVLHEIGSLIRRASKPSTTVVASLSSLTPPGPGIRALGIRASIAMAKHTPLDKVYVLVGFPV
jgi:release factor glutamine methyltransferase